jgi:hypothetical protein
MATAATTPPKPPPVSRETAENLTRAAFRAGVIGALNVLILVVAVRIILLGAVVGAIWLASIAIQAPDPLKLAVVGIYCLALVLPMVWLASRK